MYRIKEDKRCKASCTLIYKGLLSLLHEKPFEKITITDIQLKSSVGRATFYRHFDCLIDVLMMKCDIEFEKLFNSYIELLKQKSALPLERFHYLKYFLEYWSANSEILEILIQINHRYIIHQSLKRKSIILTNYLFPDMDTNTSHYNYFMAVRSGVALGILITWIEEGKVKSTDELLEILEDSFNVLLNNDFFI